jgi:hypothetical protein
MCEMLLVPLMSPGLMSVLISKQLSASQAQRPIIITQLQT